MKFLWKNSKHHFRCFFSTCIAGSFHWTDSQWNFCGRIANIIFGVFSPPVLRVPTSCCDLKLAFSFEVKILKTASFLIFESFLLSLLKTDPQREENTNWKTKFVSRVVPVTKVLIGRHREGQKHWRDDEIMYFVGTWAMSSKVLRLSILSRILADWSSFCCTWNNYI